MNRFPFFGTKRTKRRSPKTIIRLANWSRNYLYALSFSCFLNFNFFFFNDKVDFTILKFDILNYIIYNHMIQKYLNILITYIIYILLIIL